MRDDDARVRSVRRLCEAVPDAAAALGAVLDRRDRNGRMPRRLTLAVSGQAAAALEELLSARGVKPAGGGRVRLDLAHADRVLRDQGAPGLEAILDAALGRSPRNREAEESALRTALAAGLRNLEARTSAARAWLDAEARDADKGAGAGVVLARERGLDAALAEAARLVRAIEAALANREPTRLPNFAARVLGSSKALRPGSVRYVRLGRALYDHDAATRRDVHFWGDPPGEAAVCARALEANRLLRDEAPLTVLVFGPLVYTKNGHRFDHVVRHSATGDASPVTLGQLRNADIDTSLVETVTVFENLTPFLDYMDAGVPNRELVVWSRGQAGWAVVALLRPFARARVPGRFAGDLDRSGVLIWRSLRRRTGLRLAPFAMDVATHRRFAGRGRRLGAEEARRLRTLVETDDAGAPGHDLLREIASTGIWIEQEAFAREALTPRVPFHKEGT